MAELAEQHEIGSEVVNWLLPKSALKSLMPKTLKTGFISLLLALPLAAAMEQDEDILRPEVAFRYAVADTGSAIEIDWALEEGYYLYRNKMSYASNTDAVVFGAIELPQGLHHEDEFFGVQQVYRERFYVSIPYTVVGVAPALMEIVIRSQGCADIGLCYPPQTWTESVQLISRNADAGKKQLDESFGTVGGANADFLPVDEVFEPIVTALDANTVEVAITMGSNLIVYGGIGRAARNWQ